MNKDKYEEPKMEIVALSSEDMVIVTSGTETGGNAGSSGGSGGDSSFGQ